MRRYRVTQGVYSDTGERFKITDDWLQSSNTHRLLRCSWTGSTEFCEIPEYIEESVGQVDVSEDDFRGGARPIAPAYRD